jgi:hypothetical protein
LFYDTTVVPVGQTTERLPGTVARPRLTQAGARELGPGFPDAGDAAPSSRRVDAGPSGPFTTVTVTTAEVPTVAAALRARACSVWPPFATVPVSHATS